jgi:hypothetical protein
MSILRRTFVAVGLAGASIALLVVETAGIRLP